MLHPPDGRGGGGEAERPEDVLAAGLVAQRHGGARRALGQRQQRQAAWALGEAWHIEMIRACSKATFSDFTQARLEESSAPLSLDPDHGLNSACILC